jgi:hypothetical protein
MIAMVSALTAVGCSGGKDQRAVGTYEGAYKSNPEPPSGVEDALNGARFYVDLRKNHTFTTNFPGEAEGTWSLDGQKLNLKRNRVDLGSSTRKGNFGTTELILSDDSSMLTFPPDPSSVGEVIFKRTTVQ